MCMALSRMPCQIQAGKNPASLLAIVLLYAAPSHLSIDKIAGRILKG